jgi:hypothetical protein
VPQLAHCEKPVDTADSFYKVERFIPDESGTIPVSRACCQQIRIGTDGLQSLELLSEFETLL